MKEHLSKTARVYAKNIGKHFKRVLFRQESVSDAAAGIADDSDKLMRAVKGSRKPGDHHRAARYVEKGRKAYNQKRYEAAEEAFRKALLEDPGYALAHCYMGSAMYKQDKLSEAIKYWTNAVKLAPGSDAAVRAEKSLSRVRVQRKNVVTALEERID
ncbi:MAG: tetratricopeptide repeat protein [Candidatus Hydrogenedentes bacterium]|nr:tetratricopeptide repeat protein [Candidatus Hydrogenedentota bacterium]